jgi:hypothetical protein
LAGKKSVTKAEVQDYLKTNRVEVKEVTLGGGKSEYPYITADEWQGAISKAEKAKNFDEAERITAAWEDFDLGTGSTKFAKYQLPGGENYREVMLTLPVKESGASKISFKTTEDADNFLTDMSIQGYENLPYGRLNDTNVIQFDNAIPSNVMAFIRNNDGEIISGKSLAGSTYGSPHFEQPNILAHMRLNDRVDADGKKVLFVEEIQSDWHQAGRKKGYITGDPAKELDDYEKNLVTRTREAMKGNAIKDGLSEQEADAMATSIVRNTDFNGMVKYLDEVDKYTELFKKVRNKDKLVPDAPFKTSWHELSLKRAIQLASEGGYDRIAFTTGKTQAERYSLSKQVKELTATHYGGERYRVEATDINGKPAILKIVESEDELDNLIGKEFARKVIDETKGMTGAKTYSGLELDVGGEGMKGFYDTILPKYLDKYGKKWDAKVGTTKIRLATDAQDAADSKLLKDLGMDEGGQAAASVHYMDITPKMRESVLTKGQPLFQAAPVIPAGAAASQQEENK